MDGGVNCCRSLYAQSTGGVKPAAAAVQKNPLARCRRMEIEPAAEFWYDKKNYFIG